MNKLILIRHGKTKCNLDGVYCGMTNVPLCPEGISELRELLQHTHYPSCEGYDIVTSGMKRTNETLHTLYGNLPFTVDAAFREMNLGVFETKSYEELKDRADYQAWISGDVTANRTPGGESAQEMAARVYARFTERMEGDGRKLMLFTHGGPIGFLMLLLFPGEREGWYDWQPKNGRGYMVELEGTKALSYQPVPEET